jgi:hypothetical protein
MLKKFNLHITTGTADAVAPAGQVDGASLFMGADVKKVKDLSALVTVDAETSTLTMTPKWQGSNDKSTWYDIVHGTNNAAAVAIATGTGGADASVVKVIPAPTAIEGWRWARCSIIIGVVTGTTSDTYSIAYNYNQLGAGD